MQDPVVAYLNVTGTYPDVVGVNASGPSATDGFEFIANFVNDYNLGVGQMTLNHAGLSPNGVLESDSASQIKEALWKGFGGFPGEVKEWHLSNDPGTTGHRALFLNGQGILIASYPTLDDGSVGGPQGVYVGDANNAAVAAGGGFYYRASDAAGTTPDIAGPYLILPETRGYTARGLDTAASVDPDGASRFLGDIQVDAEQGHEHYSGQGVLNDFMYIYGGTATDVPGLATYNGDGTIGNPTRQGITSVPKDDGVNGVPRTSTETRMTNYSTKKVIWY